jgi:hypothetical protein
VHPVETPAPRVADRGGETLRIDVRMPMAERVPGGMKEVLPVEECEGPLDRRLSGHGSFPGDA